MRALLGALILAVAAPAATPAAARADASVSPAVAIPATTTLPTIQIDSKARPADAAVVFICGFESDTDKDYDLWPESWMRVRDARHPLYLPIAISEDQSPEGSHHLQMKLNGGAAAALSPPINVDAQFSYVLEAYVRTTGLSGNRAWLALLLYDEKGQLLQTMRGRGYRSLSEWTKLQVGPILIGTPLAKTARIGLFLEPETGTDLRGSAHWDDLWLGRLPRMELKLNSPTHVYKVGEPLELQCVVSGVLAQDPIMTMEVIDAAPGSSAKVVDRKSASASSLLGAVSSKQPKLGGTTKWSPSIREPGLYRLRVSLVGKSGTIMERQTIVAVIEPTISSPGKTGSAPGGEFGWTLPNGEGPLSLSALATLLSEMGLSRIKFPAWTSPDDDARLDAIVSFAERMGRQGIEVIGLLHNPPAQVQKQLGDAPQLLAADIFTTEAELWYPLLEPVLTRLQLQIHWWQLGDDRDISFVGYSRLPETISLVRKNFERFGQQANLGVGWRAVCELPNSKETSLSFASIGGEPALTADELAGYLSAPSKSDLQQWVVLQPLPRDGYSAEVRVSDLVKRMVAAKINGAAGVFVPDPFDPQTGLLEPEGTPGELLLPWRTTAKALSGAEYLGSVVLPGGSRNHLFARGSQVTMVIWSDRSSQETINLGESVQQLDLWGRKQELTRETAGHTIEVSSTPVLLTGIEPAIARWNMAVAFKTRQLPSLFGTPHNNSIELHNDFGQGIGGQIRLIMPDVWKVYPRAIDFKMASDEDSSQPFTITLPLDASGGKQQVQIEFDIQADRRHQFTVYREIEVGLGDVTLEAVSRLNDRGELEVEQRLTNFTDEPVNFKCLLFVPERRRLISQVVQLGRDRDSKTYSLPNGPELIGKTLWLRAEEIGGQRILNLRFVAQE